MKIKAKDTIHISAVQADNLMPGAEFEVDDATAKDLIDRGLATEVKKSVDAKPAKQKKG